MSAYGGDYTSILTGRGMAASIGLSVSVII